MKCTTRTINLLLGLTLMPLASMAQDTDYPERAINMIVAYPPGGSTDVTARIIADRLGQSLGQPVVVENRSGASGTIGAGHAAKAKPDGYTLYFGSAAELTIAPVARKDLSYDPRKDFEPVTQVGRVPLFLAVNPNNVKADNLDEFIDWMKSHSETVNYSSFGANTVNHFVGEMFLQQAGVTATHVPYKGSAPSIQDLVSGHVDYTFDTITATLPQVHANNLKIIGITTAERSELAPDIPTLSESGLEGFTADTWSSLLVPAGTPKAIINKLHDAVVEIIQTEDVETRLTDLGIEPVGSTPEAFKAFIDSEINRWSTLANEIGLQQE